MTEVTQQIKKCNISKCNTSSTPDIISPLKSHIQTLESETNFLRIKLKEKNVLVKSLATSHMLHENVHVTYKNVETNPRISPSKIIGATEFYSSAQVSNSDDVIDFHINYEQIPTKDAESKDQANLLKHDVSSETNTFSVTDETKNNEKVNIQQEDISKKNHLQDGKSGVNRKSLISNDITAANTCNDSQSVGKRKDNKRILIVGDSIIKHLNEYVIGGKTGNCNVYVRPSHGAKVRCMVNQYKPVMRDRPEHIIFHVGTDDIPLDKDEGNIAKLIVDLAMSAKSPTRDVSIFNIITRKDKHQHKAQEVNNHLKKMCTNKNINLIDHSKNIKQQHLNKSKLHITKRGTNILSTIFVREISNIFQ